MSRMKVELVKVKIDKLKEVKKQLRRKKCSTKKNLKNLLLDNDEREHEDDIFYKSINDLFQNDKSDNETMYPSIYSDNTISDYHIDLEDVLETLSNGERNLTQIDPMECFLTEETSLPIEEKMEESIKPIGDEPHMNSPSYLENNGSRNGNFQDDEIFVNKDNKNGEYREDKILENKDTINGEYQDDIFLCDNIDMESIFYDENQGDLDTTLDLYSHHFEPAMVELGNYYIPDSVFETNNKEAIEMDDICNEIEISLTEDTNINNILEEVANSETDDTLLPDLNFDFEEDISNHSENEITPNADRGVAMINPILVSIPAADLQTMALYQLQQKNDSEEIKNLGEIEILKNYNWEQRANIIAAAKMLYTKRTRTLLHWLNPKLSLAKMRATLELSWQNLPLWQKEVYITQVMGPLVMETTSPMLNPQLESGDLNISPEPSPQKRRRKERKRFADLLASPY